MLDWFATQRFAPYRSPTREGREVRFSTGATPTHGADVHEPGPDAGDAHGHEAHAEGPDAHPVEHGQHDTHNKVKDTLHGEAKYSSKETIERMHTLSKKMNEMVKKFGDMESVIQTAVRNDEQKGHLKTLKANTGFLKDSAKRMESWETFLKRIDSWEGGELHPERFFYDLGLQFNAKDPTEFSEKGLNLMIEKFPESGEWITDPKDGKKYLNIKWDVLDKSTKITIAKEFSPNIYGHMNDWMEKIETEMQHQNDYIGTLEKGAAQATQSGWGGNLGFGVEFFSINHVLAAGKNVIDAFKKATEEWSQLKISGLSHKFGEIAKYLPFGADAQQTLSQALNHKDDEVKDHYAKHLEADLAPFGHMIDAHGPNSGLLSQNKHDGNRFRGSLEYMAKKGWLYDIRRGNSRAGVPAMVMGFALIPGKTVPATWSQTMIDEYITDLETKNKSGQEAEIKRGYARVDRLAYIDPMIDIMREEIASGNYWATLGILDRTLKKAKDGETAAKIATHILRMLRSDPLARRYFEQDLFDRLGNTGLLHYAMTNIAWVIDRDSLGKWQNKSGDDNAAADKNLREAGLLGSIVAAIEEDITDVIHHSPGATKLTPPRLDDVVAKVLATQVVKLPGWTRPISLFSNKPAYKKYRDGYRNAKASFEPKNTDDDFFKEDSEVILHGKNAVDILLTVPTQGGFTHTTRAEEYLHQLMRRDRDLESHGMTEAQQIFRQETRKVMDYVFTKAWRTARADTVAELEDRDTSDKLLIAMMKKGLLSPDLIRTADTDLAKALRKKLGWAEPPKP